MEMKTKTIYTYPTDAALERDSMINSEGHFSEPTSSDNVADHLAKVFHIERPEHYVDITGHTTIQQFKADLTNINVDTKRSFGYLMEFVDHIGSIEKCGGNKEHCAETIKNNLITRGALMENGEQGCFAMTTDEYHDVLRDVIRVYRQYNEKNPEEYPMNEVMQSHGRKIDNPNIEQPKTKNKDSIEI